uniref:DUF3402 domain-containing protein n=2 Tax=Trichobilharzia regenti TaxID=157069 RepID=A0AA85KRE4_TRIRE|nr:unnamed protein product [Trichobilharzia regenti]
MDDILEDNDKKEDVSIEEPNTDIDFVYNDADEYSVEIAELYSYSEEPEFRINRFYFQYYFRKFVSVKWFEASNAERHSHIQRLLYYLESGDRLTRQKATRSLLYLLQGNFGDCELEEDQITWARHNVYLCIEAGVLQAVTALLLYEIDYDSWASNSTGSNTGGGVNKVQASTNDNAGQVSAVSSTRQSECTLEDCADLRILLSILYIMVETVRDGMLTEHTQQQTSSLDRRNIPTSSTDTTNQDPMAKLREQFVEDLASPIGKDGELTLTVVLFDMVYRFCSGLAPHFPMKKVLLLLWKVLLITLGPLSSLFVRKNQARARYGLPPLSEDSTHVIRRVRANTPPAVSTDQVLSRIPRNNNRHPVLNQSNQAPRQGCLAGGRAAFEQQQQQQKPSVLTTVTFPYSADSSKPPVVNSNQATTTTTTGNVSITDRITSGFDTPRPSSPVSCESNDNSGENTVLLKYQLPNTTTTPTINNNIDTTTPDYLSSSNLNQSNPNPQIVLPGLANLYTDGKSLPWKPKVKKKDLEVFLTNVRLKFIGFHVANDTVSLAGLPEPIHEAVRVMREHIYVSLGEVQIEKENEIAQNPLSKSGETLPDTPVERLYRAMYPMLPQYMIALLKILLAASPTSRTKNESIDILGEITPGETRMKTAHETTIFAVDINRHREIIVKAISGLLLLLLKQFKLNHIYQFEYVSQYLVFANCIPLILKFFNQNTCLYVQAKNTFSCLEFPSRLIGKPPELTAEMLAGDWSSYCWRNLFSCINLLRILNMLTKWKHSRIMLLVVFKSAPILKRTLRVRHAMLQLYVLKLLKLQSRYFGRQWRKNNMSIMSAIYQKVRHRLTDDWAYGNDVDALPWQFQVEECSLRTNVDQFIQRRYCDNWFDPEFKPVDNCLMSVLSQPVQLSDEFKQNYEKWLEEEVFSVPINWSQVLAR